MPSIVGPPSADERGAGTLDPVETAIYHPSAPHREALIAERQRLGHDRRDEVWEGVYVMSPAANRRHGRLQSRLILLLAPLAERLGLEPIAEFNLGGASDFRIPDLGFLRDSDDVVFAMDDAAIVVEVRSPGDTAYMKLGFYFRHGVEEVLIVDPETRTADWYVRGADAFVPAAASVLLGISGEEIATRLPW